ncbi:hypothetical protein DMA11_21720 [Marinilabiliaceae bacterium JC017]|nr:hypothetical protein DMA11_21720 [Marinilabiliaceae bacterium JC017]
MDLQYITDNQGHKNGVLLSISDWNKIQKDLEELQRLRNKKLFLTELQESIDEMKQYKNGKKQARNAEDFLNEL